MKIVQYNHSMYPILDGSSNYIKDIVTSIRDYEFEVVTTGLYGYPSIEKISENAIVRRFLPKDFFKLSGKSKFRFFGYPLGLIFEWIRLWNEYKYLRDSKYDILHVHSIDASISWFLYNKFKIKFFIWVVYKIIRFDKIKTARILTIHGLPLDSNPLFDEHIKELIKHFDTIVCVDRNIVEYIEALEKNNHMKKILYVPNAIDTKKFKYLKKNQDSNELMIGFIGRLEYSRGIDILIDLIERLPQYMKLIVVGSGNELAINKFKNKVDISKIELYTNVSNDKIPDILYKFDILFNPVLAEGISRATLESMSCGCPVIMIDKGNRYPVIHMKTGFLVRPNIDKILEILEYIHSNISALDEVSIQARKIVELEFSTIPFANKYMKIYDDIIK